LAKDEPYPEAEEERGEERNRRQRQEGIEDISRLVMGKRRRDLEGEGELRMMR
jgi:hypothetical protein